MTTVSDDKNDNPSHGDQNAGIVMMRHRLDLGSIPSRGLGSHDTADPGLSRISSGLTGVEQAAMTF